MKNRRIILKSRPVGIPQPAHFELEVADVPALEYGEFLVENVFLSVDPAQRGYVNEENNYAPPGTRTMFAISTSTAGSAGRIIACAGRVRCCDE